MRQRIIAIPRKKYLPGVESKFLIIPVAMTVLLASLLLPSLLFGVLSDLIIKAVDRLNKLRLLLTIRCFKTIYLPQLQREECPLTLTTLLRKQLKILYGVVSYLCSHGRYF